MSIESTKPVSIVTGMNNLDLINAQQKQPTQATQPKHQVKASANVSLKQTTAIFASSTDDINIEKVAKIKQAIATGSLVINADKIADALIKYSLDDLTFEMDFEGE